MGEEKTEEVQAEKTEHCQLEYLLEQMQVAAERRHTAEKEALCNLSRTWTGRLVLLVDRLGIDWMTILAFATLVSANVWVILSIVLNA